MADTRTSDLLDPHEATEDEGGEIDDVQYRNAKDATLFAILVSPSMLAQPAGEAQASGSSDSPAIAAIKCACELMQQRIISHPKDMMGVLLFGTSKSRFSQEQSERDQAEKSHGYPHCYLYNDLDVPDANDVRKLKDLAGDSQTSREILVPTTEEVSMSDVFFCANQIFSNRAADFSSRRLFIITDQDSPHAEDAKQKNAAIVRAKDLYDLGVTIELFPIRAPEGRFEITSFYSSILYDYSIADQPLGGNVIENDGLHLLSKLLSSISSKVTPRRALFSHVYLELSSSVRIGVKGYTLIKKQEIARSHYVHMDAERAEIAQGKTTQFADNSAREIQKAEIRHGYKFGGQQVSFRPSELASLKNYGEPVIRLIGFKKLEQLPLWARLRPATFIFPSEDEYIGSTRTFVALHRTLLKRQSFGLAWFIARRNAAPVLVAVVAAPEPNSADHLTDGPAGLWLLPLPNADDIRPDDNGNAPVIRATDALTDRMRTIIEQLQLPQARYDPAKYHNPALQWQYRILQAMALEEDLPEKKNDTTVPRHRQIDKRVGKYAIAWGEELENSFTKQLSKETQIRDATQSAIPTKRHAPADSEGLPTRKKPASSADHERYAPTDREVRTMIERDALTELSIPQLKIILERHGAPARGVKADLVNAVEVYCGKD